MPVRRFRKPDMHCRNPSFAVSGRRDEDLADPAIALRPWPTEPGPAGFLIERPQPFPTSEAGIGINSPFSVAVTVPMANVMITPVRRSTRAIAQVPVRSSEAMAVKANLARLVFVTFQSETGMRDRAAECV